MRGAALGEQTQALLPDAGIASMAPGKSKVVLATSRSAAIAAFGLPLPCPDKRGDLTSSQILVWPALRHCDILYM